MNPKFIERDCHKIETVEKKYTKEKNITAYVTRKKNVNLKFIETDCRKIKTKTVVKKEDETKISRHMPEISHFRI